jgi:hypothetical protein
MTDLEFALLLASVVTLFAALYFYSRARMAVGLRLPGKIDPLAWRPDVLDDYVWDSLFPREARRDYLKHLGATMLAMASQGGLALVSGHWPFSIFLGVVAALLAVRLIRRWARYRDRL